MSGDQLDFVAALLDPEAALPAGIVGPDGRAAPKRFAVYRNNVVTSLSDALFDGFPICAKLVGEEFFRAMAGLYVRAHPPENPVMMFYGKDFADFIANFPPAASVPYLPDMARLEYLRRESYHAADASPLDVHTAQQMPADRLGELVIEAHPSLRILSSKFPLLQIWQQNHGMDATPIISDTQSLAINRPQQIVQMSLLDEAATYMLSLAERPSRMGDLLEAVMTKLPNADIAALLGMILEGQFLMAKRRAH